MVMRFYTIRADLTKQPLFECYVIDLIDPCQLRVCYGRLASVVINTR